MAQQGALLPKSFFCGLGRRVTERWVQSWLGHFCLLRRGTGNLKLGEPGCSPTAQTLVSERRTACSERWRPGTPCPFAASQLGLLPPPSLSSVSAS